MKKNIEKTILEMFGDPIEPKMGMKIGDLPGITTIGAVGVKDMNEDDLGDICSTCGMMSVGGKCGCSQDNMEPACQGCGMQASQCQCSMGDVCPMCGMMSLVMDEPCSCAMTEAKKRKVQPRRPQRRF